MALKPTIFKVQVELADSDRNQFDSLSLTLAQHPSETVQRMAVRLLAFCLNTTPTLAFTKGLSTADEPDLWSHNDRGEIEHWIEIGQPEHGRLRKACGRAPRVSVYAFAKSADTWWNLNGAEISALPHLQVWQFDWREVEQLAALIDRTVQFSISIVGGTLYVDKAGASLSLEPHRLASSD